MMIGQTLGEVLLFLIQTVFLISFWAILLWIGFAVLNAFFEMEESQAKNQVHVALVSGIVGGLALAALNPLVTPLIFNTQVSLGMAGQPHPDFSLTERDFSEDNEVLFAAESQPNRNLYVLNVENQGQKQIKDLTLQVGFRECIIDVGLNPYRYTGNPVIEVVGQVKVRPDPEPDEVERCIEEIHVEELDPQESVSFYFITEPDPEANVTIGTMRNLDGHVGAVVWEYEWQFQGREYAADDRQALKLEQDN